jgi:hypothetical protein
LLFVGFGRLRPFPLVVFVLVVVVVVVVVVRQLTLAEAFTGRLRQTGGPRELRIGAFDESEGVNENGGAILDTFLRLGDGATPGAFRGLSSIFPFGVVVVGVCEFKADCFLLSGTGMRAVGDESLLPEDTGTVTLQGGRGVILLHRGPGVMRVVVVQHGAIPSDVMGATRTSGWGRWGGFLALMMATAAFGGDGEIG